MCQLLKETNSTETLLHCAMNMNTVIFLCCSEKMFVDVGEVCIEPSLRKGYSPC